MSRSELVGYSYVQAVLAASLLLPLPGAAQAPSGSHSASAGMTVMLKVRPAFRVLEVKPVPGGHAYRVWTNLKTVSLQGRDYRFERVGENSLVVPGPRIEPRIQVFGNRGTDAPEAKPLGETVTLQAFDD